ncbi:DUF362 domain-containing protein [Thermodesulfobacteriota bacterium]
MSTVFFRPVDAYQKTGEISDGSVQLLNRVLEAENLDMKSYVPLKVHFGEKGNQTYISPENYTGLIEFLESRKTRSAYIETNALYRGARQNRTLHLQLAEDHGFTQLPVVIADGEYGDDYTEVGINGKHFNTCLIGKAIADLEQMAVLSHFKGHMLSGFGGAIKQLAMGCASRGGKLAQHSNAIPKIRSRKCDACGDCLEMCPADAIILHPKPKIDPDRCVGCASCMAVCKQGAVSSSWWGSFGKKFRERMAEYAMAAQKEKDVIYINFILNITRGCDCMGRKMKPVVPDIGVLASIDPVAIDTASLDLVQKSKGRKIFQRGMHTLQYAQKIGLGTMTYRLLEV